MLIMLFLIQVCPQCHCPVGLQNVETLVDIPAPSVVRVTHYSHIIGVTAGQRLLAVIENGVHPKESAGIYVATLSTAQGIETVKIMVK